MRETTRTFRGVNGEESVVDERWQMYQPVENQNELGGTPKVQEQSTPGV